METESSVFGISWGGEGHSSSVAGLNVGEAHCCARRGHFAWNWNHDGSQSQLLEDLLRCWEENRTLRAALAALRDIGNSCGLKKSEKTRDPPHHSTSHGRGTAQ